MNTEQISLSNRIRQQMMAYIKQQIKIENLKLPSERELCTIFSVSRVSLRKVLAEMESEGYIARSHGKGTYINPSAFNVKLNLAHPGDLKDIIERKGYVYTSELLMYSNRMPDEEECKALKISFDQEVIEIKKVFKADGKAVIVTWDILPAEILLANISELDLSDSIFNLLKEHSDYKIVWDTLDIDAVTRGQLEDYGKDIFKDEASALLSLNAINFTLDNQPVLYIRSYMNTQIIDLNLIRQHKY